MRKPYKHETRASSFFGKLQNKNLTRWEVPNTHCSSPRPLRLHRDLTHNRGQPTPMQRPLTVLEMRPRCHLGLLQLVHGGGGKWGRDKRDSMFRPIGDEGLVMKFEVKNRLSMNVLFTAEIEAEENTPRSVKLGLAVKWAYLRGANLSGAYLRGANLHDAYLRGANLSGANLIDANLSDAYLSGANLSEAYLIDANLRGAYLHDVNLRGASLSGANLHGAYLHDANLRDAPKIENIHQSVYQAASQPAALNMGNWHTCKTTHSRAGWVTTLAGEGGKALEWALGTPYAAAVIYLASDPKLEKIPDFHASDEESLADMKRLADAEQAGL